ncbi:MAG: murein biosynthesis integral membrane protein MurJ [Patescibacteria group bacterium]
MLKKFINQESASITSAAFIIAVATLTSKVLGVVRDSIFANRFPVGDMDIYYAAFRIPDFIYNIVILGALSAGFIPIFARLISQNKKEEAFKAANNILNILFISISGLTLFAVVLTPQIIDLITGFDREKTQKTIELTRIMFLSPIFLLLSSILSGILQSYKRFLVFSLSTVVYNLGIIAGALILSPIMGLQGLAWGVVLGAFFQFAIQLPSVKTLGFRYRLFINTRSEEVRTIVKITVPRTCTIILSQINLLVITVIATNLAEGSLTFFNYANNLQSFPLGIFAVSFAIACFPALSSFSDREHREKFTEVLLSTAKQILYFIIPLSIFLVIFRAQIVRVIYGHGPHFGWNETVATIDALQIFCVSLFAQSLIPLFSRAFWAVHDSKTPFYVTLFSAVVNIILALGLSPRYGLNGLIGAFTISSILNALVLFILLDKKYLSAVPKSFYIAVAQISFSGIFAGLVGYKMLYAVEPFLDTHTFFGIAVQGMLSGTAMLAVYFAWGWIFKIDEFIKFKNSFRKKVFKTKIKTTELIAEE